GEERISPAYHRPPPGSGPYPALCREPPLPDPSPVDPSPPAKQRLTVRACLRAARRQEPRAGSIQLVYREKR
ncbi:MAG TPA: hypothetical protein VLH40_07480, partial [Atribacteraceae bacterium]|nr:hypothetical protein [Atribacteraceae bacterium]